MNRRMFLKAAGIGAASQVPLPAMGSGVVIQQGNRQLKDITPDELMELAARYGRGTDGLDTVEYYRRPVWGWSGQSLHPVYYFEYCGNWSHDEWLAKGCVNFRRESIKCTYSFTDTICPYPYYGGALYISIGRITDEQDNAADIIGVVRWFLEHGFKVW